MGNSHAAVLGHSKNTTTPTTETVTVNLASTSLTIPANFVGVSWETNDLTSGLLQGASGTSVCGLMSMLGTNGVFRVGGTSADNVSGVPLTQSLANALKSYVSCLGANWTLIYNLDYGTNDPTTAVTQAGYIINAFGLNNVVFQVGNEVAAQAGYATRWNSYYSALTTAYPTIKLGATDGPIGASTGSIEGWISGLTPGLSGLTFVSPHYYATSGTFLTAAQLLAYAVGQTFYTDLNTYSSNKVVFTEWNNESGGGVQGVTDRMMACAWYLNMMMSLSSNGTMGTNAHNVINGQPNYNHVGYYNSYVLLGDGNWWPSPEFYGELLFSKIEGQTIVATSKSGTGNVSSIATKGANGNANIIVVNNDPNYPVVVTPTQSSAWSTATVLEVEPLTAQGCFDPNATAGGKQIGESGSPGPGSPYTVANGGTVTLQPCGAALVQIQP